MTILLQYTCKISKNFKMCIRTENLDCRRLTSKRFK